MSVPDLDHQHAPRAHRSEQQPGHAVRRTLTVGAADDVAEADADRRADEALGWLAGRPAADGHLGDSRINRSPAPSAPSAPGSAAIGHEGGDLDEVTHRGIESARGGGRPLSGSVRSSMESAFGTDLGQVRIHDDHASDRISRSISAAAFTTGNDVFFSQGAYDPSSARGQHVLAHELGHVMQNRGAGAVNRLWNPFKKSAAEKAKAEEDSAKKKVLIKARAELKAKDAAVRLEAKRVNADNKAVSKRMKGSHATAPNSKNETPAQLKKLQQDFQALLERERAAREEARATFTEGVGTPQQQELSEMAEENAADAVWRSAPPEVRAFRPLRFDDFDKALNEVRELMQQGRVEEQGEASQLLAENEKAHGAPLDPDKAVKKVQEQRELERRRVRIVESKGGDPGVAALADKSEAQGKAAEKLVETKGKRAVGPGEEMRIKADAERKGTEEKYGRNEDLDDAKSGLGIGGTVGTYLGKAHKGGTSGVVGVKLGGATEGSGSQISELVGASTTGLGQVLTLISDVLGFAALVADIKSGAADSGAKLVATQKAVGVLSTSAAVTRTALMAARDGVSHFGGMGSVISEVGTALPIVGLITSVLGIIDGSLELVPISNRLGTGVQSVDEAVLANKGPLAASFSRINSRNAQLVEKASFGIAKNCTMLGLHIAEIASAGGFGIPLAAKLTVGITGAAHSLGHKIYDVVGESRSSTAKKDFGVKHKEGASRDVLKYDIGTSVDVLIVAAQKHNVAYAKKTLLGYGVTTAEIQTMRMHELREKILDGLDAEGDPKTVSEKITAAKESVKEALGFEKKPAGPEEETSTLDKVLAVPKAIGSGIAGLPAKVRQAIQSIKDNHADGRALVKAKNDLNYNGRSDRGGSSARWYADRSADKNEKSFAKVRSDLAANGVPEDQLPRTAADRKKRSELAASKLASSGGSTEKAQQIDKAFIAKVTDATSPELFGILASINQKDPTQLGNLQFLEYEVARRLESSGATSMPGPGKK